MLRSVQIILFGAMLNRINYVFYNATEILKIIDSDEWFLASFS